MAKYTDLLIQDDGIAADAMGMPILIYDRAVINQDIRHMIRESGLVEQLIAERSLKQQLLIFKKIRMLVEEDWRIVPGSSEISIEQEGFLLNAETEFGPIGVNYELK